MIRTYCDLCTSEIPNSNALSVGNREWAFDYQEVSLLVRNGSGMQDICIACVRKIVANGKPLTYDAIYQLKKRGGYR